MRMYATMLCILFVSCMCGGAEETQFVPEMKLCDINQVPEGFPRYMVPGFESELNTVRQMFYHHYLLCPGSTFNDVYIMMSIAWPDTGEDPRYDLYRKVMRNTLSGRMMTSEGYVATMQHIGLAHPDGWPFPLWVQSEGIGFHFAKDEEVWKACGTTEQKNVEGWKFSEVNVGEIEPVKGLHVQITGDRASLTTPAFKVKAIVAPFFVLNWRPENLPADAVFNLQWTSQKHPAFSDDRKMYFSVAGGTDQLIQTAVPLYSLLDSDDDTLTQIRINIGNAKGMKLSLERLFTAIDTRFQINNFVWIQGCDDYLKWTGDLNFLRSQMNRWRLALRYAINEFQVEKSKCVNIPWPNHDGRPGMEYDKQGNRIVHYGHGVGGTYFDLIPGGGKDGYATLFMYDVLLRMADLEENINAHPQWNIPNGPLRFDPKYLRELAKSVRKESQDIFWDSRTKRFVPGIDRDGNGYDYGFLYYNLEAVYYGIASPKQSEDVYSWITGKRIIKGDTSQGQDIYHWRFAPRATTKRNISYYCYSWAPKTFEWGDQVQDGGAVLAWSYYDLMNRIKINGADDAWLRLREITQWFKNVQDEGGYRKYYKTPGRGILQGGGFAGGLGLDCEFLENAMVPQVMIYGFMGLKPGLDSLEVAPQLPSEWPELIITSIRWHGYLLDITAKQKTVIVKVRQGDPAALRVLVPKKWDLHIK